MRTLWAGVAAALLALAMNSAISNQPIGPDAGSRAGGGVGSTESVSVSETLDCITPGSAPVIPPPVIVPAGIGSIKWLPDSSRVYVSQKLVTASFYDFFYIQEADRSAGIKVVCPSYIYPPPPLRLVSFSGVIQTEGSERHIFVTSSIQVDSSSVPPPIPLIAKQKAFGGRPLNSFTPGIPGCIFMHNVGLKMLTCGRVTASQQFDLFGSYIYIDDGSNIRDGSFNIFDPSITYRGMRIYTGTMPSIGTMCIATGVLSLFTFDPTPNKPLSGDEFPIRALLTSEYTDVVEPGSSGVPLTLGTVTGRLKLADNPTRPVPARIYCAYDSAHLQATSSFQPFSVERIPASGVVITATALGYLSQSKIVHAGDIDVEFVLSPCEHYLSILAEKYRVRACSSDTSIITAIYRDSEGKPLAGHRLRIESNKGGFLESSQSSIEITTDAGGWATATFVPLTEGPGVARIVAEDEKQQSSSSLDLEIVGPAIKVQAWPEDMTSAGTATVTATVTDDGQPMPNTPLIAITDWGVFAESGAQFCALVTGPDGSVSTDLQINEPGTARIVIRQTDACENEAVGWALVSLGSPPLIPDGTRLSSPIVADLNNSNDGKKELGLITSDSLLKVWSGNGTLIWSKEGMSPGSNTLACGNLDHDSAGTLELVLVAANECKVRAYSGATGALMAGWPTYSDYPFINVTAAIADVNSDGANEVIAGDQSCYVFAWNSTGNWEKIYASTNSFLWRNLTGSSGTAIYGSSVAVGDINGDPQGIPEVIVGTNDATEVFAFPGDAWGDHVSPPLYVPGWPKDADMRSESSAAIGDIDGDGCNDMVIGCDDGKLYIYYGGTDVWSGYHIGSPIKTSPALGDLDSDGKLDVVFGADNGRVYALKTGGEPVYGWEGGITITLSSSDNIESSPVIADVDGDGELDVLIGSPEGYLFCIYKDGNAHRTMDGHNLGPIAWAKKCGPAGTSTSVMSTPSIDDLDGDGKIDIIVASTGGVYRFPMDGPYVPNRSVMPWPTFRGDMQRTGCITPPSPPVYGSIVGRVTRLGQPVGDAAVYITESDDTPVYVPWSNPPVVRPPVKTVGTSGSIDPNSGGYSINQLPADKTYKLRIVASGYPEKIIPNVAVTTGVVRVDVEL